MCPTIDHTAVVCAYATLARNHAAGSENVVKNHLWKTGGNIGRILVFSISSSGILP
uniref:Uncharacterized protein n=1 Tax=Arundo donax TaxID=35708 RepID=A0A0A9G1Y2_ARUDO